MKRRTVILFGGVSAEHEVSVITGLQVVENIDRKLFEPHAIKLTKDGLFKYHENLNKKRDYLKIKPKIVNFGKDEKGAFFQTSGLVKKKTYIDVAYLAFHGGNGESGQLQGFLETLDIAYTSPNVESSAISMNKAVTKQILSSYGIPTVEGVSVDSQDVKENTDEAVKNIKIKLPVIIKPAHMGSSIGIHIAKTRVELKKYLLEAAHVDSEIVVERLAGNFTEYNVSARKVNGKVETSEAERPVSQDEILSFADKYQRGGKKTGGMASLNRELPAKISKALEKKLKSLAIEVFKAARAKGMVRIDFMVAGKHNMAFGKNIYVTEINPIPGSMSYYLWEASGISFKRQITDLIEQAIKDNEDRLSKRLNYKSDIIEKFVKN